MWRPRFFLLQCRSSPVEGEQHIFLWSLRETHGTWDQHGYLTVMTTSCCCCRVWSQCWWTIKPPPTWSWASWQWRWWWRRAWWTRSLCTSANLCWRSLCWPGRVWAASSCCSRTRKMARSVLGERSTHISFRRVLMCWGCLFIHRASTHLRVMPTLVSTLEVMALTHDVGPLLHYLLPHLTRAVFTCSSGEWSWLWSLWRGNPCFTFLLSVSAEACELAVLTSILQSLPLTSGLDQIVAR